MFRRVLTLAVLAGLIAISCVAASNVTVGNELLAAGKLSEAKSVFARATVDDPRNGEAWFGLGETLLELHDDDAALPALQKAVELQSHANAAGVALALLHLRAGRRDAALAAIRSIVPPAPAAVTALSLAPELEAYRNDSELAHAISGLHPCSTPEFRQFDFWLGEWDVVNATGVPLGKNSITSIHGGCGIQEQWTSSKGGSGSSVSFYDVRTAKWHQFWVDGTGLTWLSYDAAGNPATARGTFHNGVMELFSDPATKPLMRGMWTPLPDGRVRQAFDQSDDGGKTWKNAFEGFYVRRSVGAK